jgi:hypothetical protein
MEAQYLDPPFTEIREQGPQLRCYVCGNPNIHAICHHCGRPMCSLHSSLRPMSRLFFENREYNGISLGVWPLDNTRPAHCHEHAHSSPNYRRIMIAPGILILLASLWFLFLAVSDLGNCLTRRPENVQSDNPALSEMLRDPEIYTTFHQNLCYQPELAGNIWRFLQIGIVSFFATATTGVGIYLNKERIASDLAGWRPKIPLAPVSDRFQAIEQLYARLTIDDLGKSIPEMEKSIEGTILTNLQFTPRDQERVKEYRQKYEISAQDDVSFHAGFLVLSGQPFLKFQEPNSGRTGWHNLFPLTAELKEQAYLVHRRGARNLALFQQLAYQITLSKDQSEDSWKGIPVRLVPLLSEIGNDRSLRLEIQLNSTFFPNLHNLYKNGEIRELGVGKYVRVDEIYIDLNSSDFGRPQTSGLVIEKKSSNDGLDAPVFRVTWRDLLFPIDDGILTITLPPLKFPQPIKRGTNLVGTLRIRVPSLISGLTGVLYFSSLGNPVKQKDNPAAPYPYQGTSLIHINFDVSLTPLSRAVRNTHKYQLPGDLNRINNLLISTQMQIKNEQSEDESKSETENEINQIYSGPPNHSIPENSQAKSFYQCAPSPELIQQLISMLSRDPGTNLATNNISLRKVQHDPPRIDESDAQLHRWYWDIAGRYYPMNIPLPVDFHLVIYGSGAKHREKINQTYVDLTIHGQTFDDESNHILAGALGRLATLTHQAFVNAETIRKE